MKQERKIEQNPINRASQIRKDVYGNIITKGKNKKHKISFSGFISQNDCDFNQLITTINIESYKQYNAKMSYIPNEKIDKAHAYCTTQTCFII